VAKYVESVLGAVPEIKHYTSNVGHGNPKVYYNYFSREYQKNFTEFLVELDEYDPDKFHSLLDSLRNTFADYPSADIMIKEFSQGVPIQNPVEVVIYGNNLKKLQQVSEDVAEITGQQPGIINVDNRLDGTHTGLFVKINKDKAAMLGVPVSEIDKTVRIGMSGSSISKYRDEDGEEYDIVLRLPVDKKVEFEDFEKIFVKSLSGKQIPLSQLASIEFKESPSLVTHYNLKRSATIGADVAKGYNTFDVTKQLEEQLKRYDFPYGFTWFMAGEVEKQIKSFGNLGSAAVAAILIILAILVLQFKSFRQPFIIFTSVPMALIGSFYALLITGFTFSFTAFVGAVALIGIVINDAIILIDFANELRKEGSTVYEALVEAAQIRFTPILITSLTTMGGMLPLTLQGGTFWGPLGWTVIGGLTLSTALTLILVPVLYKMMAKETTVQTETLPVNN
jgi:multidrug efflux pump subunit AcrB